MTVSYASNRVTITGSHKTGTALSGSTSTTIEVTSGAIVAGDIGRLLAWVPSASNSDETQIRQITGVSGTTITVHDDWVGSNPASGNNWRVAHNLQDVHDIGSAALEKIGDESFRWNADWNITSNGFLGDVDKALEMKSNASLSWPIEDGSIVQFGILWGGEGNNAKEGTKGCRLSFETEREGLMNVYSSTNNNEANGPVINYYGCLIESREDATDGWMFQRMEGPTRFIGCILDGQMGGRYFNDHSEFYNLNFSGNDNVRVAYSPGVDLIRDFSNVRFFQNTGAIKNWSSIVATMRNITFEDSNTDFLVVGGLSASSITFIDSTNFDTDKMTNNIVAPTDGTFVQQKSVNYTIKDSSGTAIENCLVRVGDKNDDTQDTAKLSDSSGVVPEILCKRWDWVDSDPSTSYHPFNIRIRKYGKIWVENTTPLSAEISQELQLADDGNVTQTEAAASSITGVSITFESSPVTWNGKDFSITVTGNLTTNPSLDLDDIKHHLHYLLETNAAVAGKDSGGEIHNLIPMAGTESTYSTSYSSDKGVRIIDQAGNSFPGVTRHQADDGTYYTVPATFTINSSESGSDIRLFTNGTQTELDSATGSSLAYSHSGETVGYTVQKAGFIPQRFTGKVLSGDETVTVNLVADPVYNSGHGLTYTVDAGYNRSTKKLTVSTTQDGDDIYSLLIDSFISETSLRNTEFPVQMNGASAAIFINDAEIIDTTSLNRWKRVGVQYVNTGDVVTAEYAAVFTLSSGIPGSAQAEYQQTAGAGTTDAINVGDIDELIQIYGDATHGNFTQNTYLVVKYQENTYQESRIDIPSLYSITTILPTAYPIPTPVNSIGITAGDPGITGVTITNHGATPVSWDAGNGSKDYSLTITDTGSNTGGDILRWLNYFMSLDATFQGEDPFNWPYMVEKDGTKYRTERGVVEGSAGATLKGVRVIDGSNNPHPDFSEFTADDGTLGIPPAIATFRAANVANGANYMLLHRQTFVVTEASINATTNEITLTTDTNGDAPAFDVTTANRHTLVRIILADGATIPTTSTQIINNGTYRVASESSGVITLEVTEGGGAIDFIDDGTNGSSGYVFVAVFETLIAEGTTSGGAGVSESFLLSNNATYRFKTIHQDNTGGPRKTTNFIDVVGAWSSSAGATYTSTVDATDTAQTNLWTEPNRIADLTSYVLEDKVVDNNGTVITDFDPVEDGQDIGGISFALEGKGFIQINAGALTKNAASLNGAIAGQDVAMWAVYEIAMLDNMWLASDQTLVFNGLSNIIIDNVEFDNTSPDRLQIYGANIREKDGSPIVSENLTGSIVPNVATRGSVGVIETGVSGLTSGESAKLDLIATVDTKVDTIDTVVDAVKVDTTAILADTNELQGDWEDGGRLDLILDATATQALLTTVDGKIDIVDTVVDSIKADTAAILIDTNELQQDWTNDGRLDLILDATATQANLTTLQTDVTAVKAKTDQLTFTLTNQVDSNVQSVNDVELQGAGVEGDSMRPA